MLASLMTPPLEPSLSMAKDRAETRQTDRQTGQTWLFDGLRTLLPPVPQWPAAAVCTCSSELQTFLFGHVWFVVGVHEAVDVGAATAAH